MPAASAPTVAVVAHRGKTFGGGLSELRALLAAEGVTPAWYEVDKSRKAPKRVRRALRDGAQLLFVWGGDGMVQRCLDTIASARDGDSAKLAGAAEQVAVAILPAGTANLFAANLGIPTELPAAVRTGLAGRRRRLDLGRINGEHFAVMAGAGFDGEMIKEVDGGGKDRWGRLAYALSGLRHMNDRAVPMRIAVDGRPWFEGEASCVLLGNVGTITGGVEAFDDARPDDGVLDVGVATAANAGQWARTLGRMALGRSADSPFVEMTQGTKIKIKLSEPMVYELDGGDRGKTTRLTARAVRSAVTLCLPTEVAAAD
jgi:diacylglycerol kinase (ATP)